MSLYIGNLSSRTRKNELERVFLRFGQCDVRLKDGYGFVVYEYPPNAEKALRALQEKYICGEPLILTWSNKQPRPFRRSGRAVGYYDRRRVRDSARAGEYARKELDDQQDLRERIAQRDRDGGGLSSDEMLDVEAAHHGGDMQDYIVEGHLDHREDLNGGGRVEPNLMDDDRWGMQFHDPPNENDLENEVEFDRYEPFQDYGGKYDDEEPPVKPSSHESAGRDHIGEYSMHCSNVAKSIVCYKCGAPGHKMRYCPQGNHSRRKFSRSDSRHDQDNMRRGTEREELVRLEYKPGEKLRSSRNSGPVSRQIRDVKSPHSQQHQRSRRDKSSPVINEANNCGEKDYGGNKRSRKAIESAKKYSRKKAKRSASYLRSDNSASRSHSTSHSSKHIRGYHSRFKSRSVSSGAHSASSDSKSSSTTKNLRSEGSKSRSRTKSSSPTSLSVSSGQPLLSSPKKAPKNHRDEVVTSEMEVLIEKGQTMQADTRSEGAKSKHQFVATNDGTATSSSKSGELEKDQPLLKKTDNFEISLGPRDVTGKSTQLVDETALISGSLSEERLKGIVDCQNSDTLMTKHVSVPANNVELEGHGDSCACHSLEISPQELTMVLEHYHLRLCDESERPLLPGTYFGSARLWPWEMIYYRRLKKGPISPENYARRVDQNKEFGIVDKYIRSSSGWGELGQAKL